MLGGGIGSRKRVVKGGVREVLMGVGGDFFSLVDIDRGSPAMVGRKNSGCLSTWCGHTRGKIMYTGGPPVEIMGSWAVRAWDRPELAL